MLSLFCFTYVICFIFIIANTVHAPFQCTLNVRANHEHTCICETQLNIVVGHAKQLGLLMATVHRALIGRSYKGNVWA